MTDTSSAAIRRALSEKPRWAQACPKSFAEMQGAIAKAAVLMAQMPLLSQADRTNLTHIIGHVAATCWAAGAASVKEAAGEGTPMAG